MNKINFHPQKKLQENKIRNITPTLKSTNKNIENFHFPKNNISIEFSPKMKQVKKRNIRNNSYSSFIHNKTETSNLTNKKIRMISKDKEHLNTINNFHSNNFHHVQALNKINNNGIPFHKKNNSMKKLIKSNFLGNKKINNKNFHNNNLQHSYMLSTSNLNINFNNMDNSNIKNKSQNKNNNYINTYENESINFSLRDKKEENLSKNEIKLKIEKINNELNELINKVNNEEKEFIFKEIENNYNSLLENHNINETNIINNLITDNNYLKEQNKKFNQKIDNIENFIKTIKQENKIMKEDLSKKDKIIKDIQNNILIISNEFNTLKYKNNKEEKQISEKRNERENDLNISLTDNININNNNNINNKKQNINNKNIINIASNINKFATKLNLKIEKHKDFNDEFLENYNEFSPSWRKEVDKMIQRKQNKK